MNNQTINTKKTKITQKLREQEQEEEDWIGLEQRYRRKESCIFILVSPREIYDTDFENKGIEGVGYMVIINPRVLLYQPHID